jgi:hypothetical protein
VGRGTVLSDGAADRQVRPISGARGPAREGNGVAEPR